MEVLRHSYHHQAAPGGRHHEVNITDISYDGGAALLVFSI